MTPILIDNAPIREAFLASGVSADVVAERAGVMRKFVRRRPGSGSRLKGDGTTLLRELGIKQTSEGRIKKTIPLERALKYTEAMGLFPVDVGL